MKAILHDGNSYKALSYTTALVTLEGKTKPIETTWSDVDYLIGDDGLMRHRDVVEGRPKIIVQPLTPPPSVRYEPPVVQSDLFSPAIPRAAVQNDIEGAKEMLNLVDDETLAPIYRAIKEAFAGREMELWESLSSEQQIILKKGKHLYQAV
jgi:hypothetical protein